MHNGVIYFTPYKHVFYIILKIMREFSSNKSIKGQELWVKVWFLLFASKDLFQENIHHLFNLLHISNYKI